MSVFNWAVIVTDSGRPGFQTLHSGWFDPNTRQELSKLIARGLTENAPKPPKGPKIEVQTDTMTQREISTSSGYTGDCCSNCGEFRMKRNGSCLSCDGCGTTTGCS